MATLREGLEELFDAQGTPIEHKSGVPLNSSIVGQT